MNKDVHINTPFILPVIAGPTGSGKSGLAIELGQYFPIEIISADSRTVYKWLDVGTAKPTISERRGVRHHLFDVITPFEIYSAGQFREDIIRLVPEIISRGKIPVIVGGSGLYIKALDDLFDPALILSQPELRKLLNTKSLLELQQLLELLAPVTLETIDLNNPRRIIRALEKTDALYYHFDIEIPKTTASLELEKPSWSAISVLSIERDRAELHQRIGERSAQQWLEGILIETGWLISTGLALDAPAFTGTGYRDCADFLTANKSRKEAFEANVAHNRQLARRQLTWLRHQHPNRSVLNISSLTYVEALHQVKQWFEQFFKSNSLNVNK